MDVKTGKSSYACCALCPTKLYFQEEKELKEGGFVKVRNTDNYQDIKYLLSNNSFIRIGVCKDCHSEACREENFPKLIKSVIDGWMRVTDKKDQQKTLDYFNPLKIVMVVDG